MHLIIDCTTTQNQLKYNGIGVYTKNVVRRLVNDYDLDIILLMFNGESTLDPYLKGKSAHIERLGKLKLSDYKNVITYFTKILPAIKKVRKEDSIYFCPYFWIGIPSLHIPTVLVIHDFALPVFNTYSEKGYIQNIIKKILYWLELRKAKYCEGIIVDTKYTAKDFKKYFPKYPKEKIFVTHLDGELEESKDIKGWDSSLPKDYKERGYFIYLGGTPAKSKNSDGVVRGYREFLVKMKFDKRAPYLVISGKNFTKEVDPNVEKLKSRVSCLGLKDSVIFTGFYENRYVKPLLSNSISFIHLSLYEGFGISLIEAMRAGTPVIAHRGSCYPEVLGNGGVLVDGLNAKEVGDVMYKIYTEDRYRDELIKKGKERAKDFSWDETVEKTVRVFKEIEKEM